MIRPTTAAMTDLLHESFQIGGEEGYGHYAAEDTLAPAYTIKHNGRYVQGGKRHAGVGTFWREDHNTAPTWRKLDPKSWDSKKKVPLIKNLPRPLPICHDGKARCSTIVKLTEATE